jgi:signal transduction histidine kinase
MQTNSHEHTLLIVDDDPKNVRLMRMMLQKEEYRVMSAGNGQDALALIEEEQPDLVLLDIMMPGIDGFKTCEILKSRDSTSFIPIIMVTALQEKAHRIRAMESGADDFITKPIDQTELLIRVKSLLRIKVYHDRLLQSFEEITEKNQILEELQLHKEYLTHMIVHDMRNPLNAITMGMELLMLEDSGRSAYLNHLIETCSISCTELEQMIQNMLDIRKMEDDRFELNRKAIDVHEILEEVVKQFRLKLDSSGITFEVGNHGRDLRPSADYEIVRRIIANLLNNAIRHTPEGGCITVAITKCAEENALRFSMHDSGVGIPREFHQLVFKTYEQIKTKTNGERYRGYGLGLAFCRLAVEAHGGRIWVESVGKGKGSTFTFLLPL